MMLPKKINPNLVEPQQVEFKCNCPPRCVCGSKTLRKWVHESCHGEQFINSNGDIFCSRAYFMQGCEEYFIQHARFKCRESQQQQKKEDQTYMQFRTASEFLMAIAQAAQSAKFELSDNDLVQFVTKLNQNVVKKWVR